MSREPALPPNLARVARCVITLSRWSLADSSPARAQAEIDFTVSLLAHHVSRLREMSPLWELKQEGVDLSTIQWSQDAH